MNSRDASLRVETWSLQALALLRANQPDMGRVANLLSKILGEKSYYGYGSTQATVLALKAITAYGRLAGKVAGETEIDFTAYCRLVTIVSMYCIAKMKMLFLTISKFLTAHLFRPQLIKRK